VLKNYFARRSDSFGLNVIASRLAAARRSRILDCVATLAMTIFGVFQQPVRDALK